MESLTDPGETYGTMANRVKQMALDEINAARGITWSGGIGDNYSFDEQGEVVGLTRVVVEVLPTSERTAEKVYRVLGPAPKE